MAKIKYIPILLLVLINLVLSSPIPDGTNNDHNEIKLLTQDNEITSDGYKFSYDLSDGQHRDEQLIINNKGTATEEYIVKGSYSFKDSAGKTYAVHYEADRNGYRPKFYAYYVTYRPVSYVSPALVKSLIG